LCVENDTDRRLFLARQYNVSRLAHRQSMEQGGKLCVPDIAGGKGEHGQKQK
jgi:hypothetical protein